MRYRARVAVLMFAYVEAQSPRAALEVAEDVARDIVIDEQASGGAWTVANVHASNACPAPPETGGVL